MLVVIGLTGCRRTPPQHVPLPRPTPPSTVEGMRASGPIARFAGPSYLAADFSADTSMIAAADSSNAALHFYKTADGREFGRPVPTPRPTKIPQPGKPWDIVCYPYAVALRGDGKIAAIHSPSFQTNNDGQHLVVMDVKTRKRLFITYVPHLDQAARKRRVTLAFSNPLLFSPDGSLLAATTVADNEHVQIYLWSTRTWKIVKTLEGPQRQEYNPQTSAPLIPGQWSIDSKGRRHGARALYAFNPETTCLVFSPDGKCLLQGRQDKCIVLWDIPSGKAIRTIKGLRDPIDALAFTRNGKEFAAATKVNYPHSPSITPAEARVMAAKSPTGVMPKPLRPPNILFYDTTTGKLIRTWPGAAPVAYSPDDKRLAGTDPCGGNIDLWDIATQKLLHQFAGTDSIVTYADRVVFSPNGKRLFASTSQAYLYSWVIPDKL